MDAEDTVDLKKREFLVKATSVATAAGVACMAVPFVSSMLPSKDTVAAGAPVRVKVGEMQPGQQLTVEYRGRPVWIIRRTPEALASLDGIESELRDPDSGIEQQPDYARNKYRSIKPEFLVLVGVCTHLGCAPTYRPDQGGITPDWKGGFYCSCHGSKFDFSGRVYKGVPAPINLEVPRYAFVNDDEIIIGVDQAPTEA